MGGGQEDSVHMPPPIRDNLLQQCLTGRAIEVSGGDESVRNMVEMIKLVVAQNCSAHSGNQTNELLHEHSAAPPQIGVQKDTHLSAAKAEDAIQDWHPSVISVAGGSCTTHGSASISAPQSADGGTDCAEIEPAELAEAFLVATTKLSNSREDILPQEDSEDMQLSVFNVFEMLFPQAVSEQDPAEDGNRLSRKDFNRIGYSIYKKKQSRRVPARRGKPGNPGYGFGGARWRNTSDQDEDRQHSERVLRAAGCSEERIQSVQKKVQEACKSWDLIRGPVRPGGPGRPRKRTVVSWALA